MSSHWLRTISVCVCMVAVGVYLLAQSTPPPARKHVDLHSAIALSQAHLYGTTGVTARADRTSPVADVLILVTEAEWATVRARLASQGMAIQFDDARSGYMRVTVPFSDVRRLFEWPEIDAVRVDGVAAFDSHLQPQVLRTTLGFSGAGEVLPSTERGAPAPPTAKASHPLLTRDLARRYPINTDHDMGVPAFRAAYPTFDGRGVGIGILETTGLAIDHPAYADARALDGTPRRKVLRYPDVPSTRAEGTSARFSEWFDCRSAICKVKDRILRLPAAGRYRLADFSLVWPYPFGCQEMTTVPILQREDTGRLYVDRNRDLDFLDEPPVVDFNTMAWDARSIVSFRCGNGPFLKAVITIDADDQFVRLHPFGIRHVTMVSSVAAGSDAEGNLAVGVAPNASFVAVDTGSGESVLSQYLESAVTLVRDPDVDLMVVASAIQTPLGTSESFANRAFDRISETYNKPIVISAGNYTAALGSSPAPGGSVTMAVGQYVSAANTEAWFGLKRPEAPVVASTVGPAWDGGPRPDFIAASKRIAAFPCIQGKRVNSNRFDVPPCYTISGGTSAASPSAGGVVALLLSGAKQRGLRLSVAEIREALLASSRLMPGLPIHMQGTGLIDASRAWAYLEQRQRPAMLTIEGELRHPFVGLLGGARPKGLFWIARSSESQRLTLQLPAGKSAGRLSVRSHGDLELATESSVDTSVTARVPVTLTPPALGRVASSWMTFVDPSGVTVGRALATAVRPAPLGAPTYEYAWKDDIEIESLRGTVVAVPARASSLLIEVDRPRGDVVHIVTSPLGAPAMPRTFWSGIGFSSPRAPEVGSYNGVLMNSVGGDWGVVNVEYSTVRGIVPTPLERVSVGVRVTAFRTGCSLLQSVVRDSLERVRVAVDDIFAKPVNGGVLLAPATRQTERVELRDEFERRPVTIDVKPGTALFQVAVTNKDTDAVMLQLFDCTQGHCIPVTQTVPGDPSPALNVRQPHAGAWTVFTVPVRAVQKAMNIEVSVTQAYEANLTALAPMKDRPRTGGQVFEGDVPSIAGTSAYVLLRTDQRAKVNNEGWGAVSVCAIQNTVQRR